MKAAAQFASIENGAHHGAQGSPENQATGQGAAHAQGGEWQGEKSLTEVGGGGYEESIFQIEGGKLKGCRLESGEASTTDRTLLLADSEWMEDFHHA